MADRPLGQVAYEKYVQVLAANRPLLPWERLRPPVQARWEAVATAVLRASGGGK